ncbi:MAG TPA: HAD family hydrolase [Burkholderiales bacterium]|nr:HAD family hydrolase [Burkholderiales bacterium]
MRRAVFLDRDGVINQSVVRDGKPYPPDSPAEMRIIAGVQESLASLRDAGFLNIVVTNQPDVATGRQNVATVEAMHRRLREELALDDIKVCYHRDADGCDCRKPKPGMLLQAARELGIDLARSFMVGDRWRDVAAGQAAGCTSFFVDYGYREKRPDPPYITVKSLAEAGSSILAGFPRENKD